MPKVTTFKPMRSCAPDFEKFPIEGLEFLMSRKLDGIRFVKYQGKALSKSMKPIANDFIRNWIEVNVPEWVDGEIIVGQPNLGELTYNNTIRGVATIKGEPDFKLYLFDIADDTAGSAEERMKLLKSTVNAGGEWTKRVVVVEQTLVKSVDQVEAEYQKYLAEGYEGAILKDPAGLYKYGRCTPKARTQLKLKPEDDADAEILSLYEALHNSNEAFTNELGETDRTSHQENKYGNGMLGGFRVKDCVTGVVFNVAAGVLKHDERKAIWESYLGSPEKFTGEFIKYRSMSYGVLEGGAPRHPRFYAWRAGFDV